MLPARGARSVGIQKSQIPPRHQARRSDQPVSCAATLQAERTLQLQTVQIPLQWIVYLFNISKNRPEFNIGFKFLVKLFSKSIFEILRWQCIKTIDPKLDFRRFLEILIKYTNGEARQVRY